jgi:hypothetical protein
MTVNLLRSPKLSFEDEGLMEEMSSLTLPQLIGELDGIEAKTKWEYNNRRFVRGWRMRQMLRRQPGLLIPQAQEYIVDFGLAPDEEFALNALENTIAGFNYKKKNLNPEDYPRTAVFVTGSLYGHDNPLLWNIYAVKPIDAKNQKAYRMYEIPHNPNI